MPQKDKKKKEGVSEIRDLLRFFIQLIKSIESSISKKFKLEDVGKFIPTLLAMTEAFDDIPKLVRQFKDLDAEEVIQLKVYFQDEFDLKHDIIEETIEDAIEASLIFYRMSKRFSKK